MPKCDISVTKQYNKGHHQMLPCHYHMWPGARNAQLLYVWVTASKGAPKRVHAWPFWIVPAVLHFNHNRVCIDCLHKTNILWSLPPSQKVSLACVIWGNCKQQVFCKADALWCLPTALVPDPLPTQTSAKGASQLPHQQAAEGGSPAAQVMWLVPS